MGAGKPGHVGGQTAADHQDRLLAQEAEGGEGVDDPLESAQRLVGFFDGNREDGQVDPVKVEIGFNFVAVQPVHRLVHDHQTAPELPIAVGDLGVADCERTVDKEQLEVDLLVGFYVEAVVRRSERRVKRTHRYLLVLPPRVGNGGSA